MKRGITLVLMLLLVGNVESISGGNPPRTVEPAYGAAAGAGIEVSATASSDTVQIMGPWSSDAIYNGEFEDYGGSPSWNGWTHRDVSGTFGDYTHVRSMMSDVDPDPGHYNYSPLVCFVADDRMYDERGLPVQYGVTWTYGPGGYTVHSNGGLAGPGTLMHMAVESPVLEWPAGGFNAALFEFDVYCHETLDGTTPGVFYSWAVRSTADNVSLPIASQPWLDTGFQGFGGPAWSRSSSFVTDLIVQDPTHVQLQLSVFDLADLWVGTDGTPAPYFDNVSLKAFDHCGPLMTAQEKHLAQDNFPEEEIHSGDEMDLNSVRFDMAWNEADPSEQVNRPGDYLIIEINPVRTGAAVVVSDVPGYAWAPRLHWKIKPGVSVDPTWRTMAALTAAGFDDTDDDGNLYGDVVGGMLSGNQWAFDLPDNDFLFPGDVVHYYFEAWDYDSNSYEVSTLPGELDSFDEFDNPLAYHPWYVMRALPTLFDETTDSQTGWPNHPKILFWDDFGDAVDQFRWKDTFANLGFYEGEDYDRYVTRDPAAMLGNGLGGRAAFGELNGYDVIVYSSGVQQTCTISPLDFENDAGDDVGVLDDWLANGDKFLFATGDNLASDMVDSGTEATQFVTNWMGLLCETDNLSPLMDNRKVLPVYAEDDSGLCPTLCKWNAFGGWGSANTFDGVIAIPPAERLAYFPANETEHSAYTGVVHANGSKVRSMPYDLMNIWTWHLTDPMYPKAGSPAPLATRALLLAEALEYFGIPSKPDFASGTDLPGKAFSVNAYPNPFNPSMTIEYAVPRAGHLSLKIFTVRGELVRTLVNEVVAEGFGRAVWDGTNGQGRRVPSGIYLYEVQAGGAIQVNKIALVK